MSTADRDASQTLLEQVSQALHDGKPLRIQGGNSKAFLGRPVSGEPLDTREHRGIVSYDPTELVITARAGTPLNELMQALDAAGQMLPCEPPDFGMATLGGMVAAGLSGPRRPWSGSVRDFVLGTRVITGLGKHLRFGGEVMKNVAGYDVSRLLTGSFGCLGLLTEVSLKVLPKPRLCNSIALEMDSARALACLTEWAQQPMPISAASHDGRVLRLRLEGGEGSVAAAHQRLGGELSDTGYWQQLNEQRLAFFQDPRPLWRISLPADTGVLSLPGEQLIDWGGAQRWLRSDAESETIRTLTASVGGHATCYRHNHVDSPFQPLAVPLLRYHQALKAGLDPQGIFNPGRLYAEL
ncbi:glycolate oxidase subunit GlcE [Pseudomonas cannabina]|uniref:Glycolate oxidase FAD binding subunit n=3 Tax=Pseudomonas syringae group TaxID=136849 RepID=A0A3M3PWE1_PSECA|nr:MULTISPECIES: glycolate oxidase subunit GlcE [Pseudomonas syringae group]KPB69613.1 Glycolate oxidase FAD binding subunit [Pseudomonas syringae pv. maculicola]KPW21462.1 Glycolate oxidase FAD binding subunit [Pseudomonas cannabina pv. alisalensis]MBM0137353.1 glycolate oxidase subunit GlcE [Pseudomonas cannabina pv. alisalensis]QHE97809.1 glycolate oxidase subunit GlcE [Pseudomonas syringae pv. maculicola str. ES4326]QQN23955.1 glycolate oxidase subunit GlcE [Pseudomonas cannabina pv. alisa